MTLFLYAVGILVLSGLVATRWPRGGVAGAIVGGAVGLFPALHVLLTGATESLWCAWQVPYGSFAVQLDPLSAFFLIPVFGLPAVAAMYGSEYLAAWRGKKPLGAAWCFYNLLTASMALVVVARNGVLFLVAWEVMALTSFFLVTFEDEQETVRAAGWTYLVASHLGTAFLLVMFILLGRETGSLDFDKLAVSSPNVVFLLALIGFGTKAGFMPLHVWLPDAHPAAPSHVSAVMSGVMIKMGIYGILRILTLIGPPPAWWGGTLIGIGLVSGVLGILFAVAQSDLKRLLAYSSVENIGIITLGLGVGLLGIHYGVPVVATLGFAGALLHVINHALFKGLLFFGAGAVLHGTHTRNLEQLGGLLKRMPWTGLLFALGAVAICALPPLNGFIGEFLIYLGAYRGALAMDTAATTELLSVIAGLALIGGLAAVSFTKAFGVAFLGEPRSEPAAHAREAGLLMQLAMLLLAAGCVLVGLLAPAVVRALAPALKIVTGLPAATVENQLANGLGPLGSVVLVTSLFLVVLAALVLLRRSLLAGRTIGQSVTWDCGYAQPTVRMQYSASSFAQPVTGLFAGLLRTRRKLVPPEGLFPRQASLETTTPDAARETIYQPAFGSVGRGLGRWRWLQHGNLHLYILYIALTLLVLLIWRLG